jgi:hypothetical protein
VCVSFREGVILYLELGNGRWKKRLFMVDEVKYVELVEASTVALLMTK